MGSCIVFTGIGLLLLICPFIFSFFFLSNFQTLHFFVTLFSGTVRLRRLKLGIPMDSRQMYRVYGNQAAAAYWSLYFSFVFLSNFQTLKFFVTLFSGTVRPRRLKVYTHVDNGRMYHVYGIMLLFLFIPLFLSFSFSNFHTLQLFVTLFWGTVTPWRLKLGHTWTVGRCIVYTGIRLLLHICLFISSFFFLSIFKH